MRTPLEKELKSYREQGISLYLNGILSNPKTIAKACQIADGGGYMRDYTEDENGHIARVDFDFPPDLLKATGKTASVFLDFSRGT